MKKFFSLVLALVMALSLTTVAWGAGVSCGASCADDTHVAAIGDTHYTSLKDAVADVAGVNAASGAALNAATEIVLLKDTKDSFDIGKSTGSVAKNIVLNLNNKTLTLGPGVGSSGTKTQGIRVLAYSQLEVKNGNIVCSDVESDSVKVAIANYGTLTLTNVDVNAGPYVLYTINNRGDLTLDGTTSVENGQDGAKLAIAHSVYNYYYTDFDASITIDSEDVVVGAVDVSLAGNDENDGDIILNISAGSVEKITETDADAANAVDVTGNITGGTFGSDVPDTFVADGYQLLANGTVVTTPAAGAVAPTLYVWDTAAKDWATYYIATGDDLDDLKLGADENCLPCYFIDGRYFVDTTEAVATYKLVYGATKLFLAPVDVTDVRYLDKATVFTNVTKETDECGKLVVTDTTKTYYVAYDEDNYDEDYYFVATKNGPIQLLVGGKIVDVAPNGAQDLTAHVWKGHDVVNNAYTTAKCENCGKVVKLYATGTAAGKGAHYEAGLGYITKIDNGFGTTVVTPSTDKTVTSAETFDAGIAMYVGMSVMAAAGSAVVIGKKKD